MLTKEQLKFLEIHGISLDETFDASGMTRSQYDPIMKEEGKIIAYNLNPCVNGHTMRDRKGHCPQCNSACLGYLRRSDAGGVVYVAGSIKGQVIKVGYSKSVEVRAKSLIRTSYGELKDWKMLFAIQSAKAGKIEEHVKSKLKCYSEVLSYRHDKGMQDGTEMYRCSYKKAIIAIKKICDELNAEYTIVLNSDNCQYDFPNLRHS